MYNIILVDDEVRTVDALAKNVDWHKCGIDQVFKANNMQSAIQLMTSEKIEILICDIEMPNGSGLQILEWMRNNNRDINCIFVTCHPEFSYMRKAIQLNCYDYILKPIDYDEFTVVLTGLIHKMEAKEVGAEDTLATQITMKESPAKEKSAFQSNENNLEKQVKKYVSDHLVDSITLTDIGEALHFNPQYLMRIFKSKTGMSILEYITNERVAAAKNILEKTDLPIKIVSSMVGYEDYAYFTRVFKKNTNLSPSQYRQKVNKNKL